MRKLDKTSFIYQVNALKQAKSVRGKIYHSINVIGNSVRFLRQGKPTTERINLDELFELYQVFDNPTTKEARVYISGRVQSPAVSIINSLGREQQEVLPNEQQKQIESLTPPSRTRAERNATPAINKEKDETRFFQAFAGIVGAENLLSKSVGKPITAADAFLSDDFREYAFSDEVNKTFESFLEKLKSNFNFSAKSLAHYIDGLLLNHPQLGSRIVEFDEEQHFTPLLLTALNQQSKSIKLDFEGYYQSALEDVDYLNHKVLKKNRVKQRFATYPNLPSFLAALKNQKLTGYIKPKENGFCYVGGRIAQRAYYDALRNAAHLSPKNPKFNPILRFPKKLFEDKGGMKFSSLSSSQIKTYLKDFMLDIYGFDKKILKI